MDSTAIAATYVAFSQAQTGQAIQTAILKNAISADASVVALLQEGAQSLEGLASPASPAPGLGTQVDISV